MKLKLSTVFFLLPLSTACLAATTIDCKNPSNVKTKECEVTIRVQMWNYQRIYPLLDGLFQDIDATQVGTLVLNPNSSNGTQVDAVMQSVQTQIGYSKLAAAQNQAAVQMMQANTASQSALLQNQTSLMTTLVSEEQAYASAQAKQAQDAGATTDVQAADSAQVASTAAAVQATKDAITQLTTQLVTPAYNPSAATGAIANSVAAPTAIPTSSLAPSNTSVPSFPATKQMDNQVQLLWERLARVVGAMVKADSSRPGDSIYFVQIDLGIFPINRKGRLLDVNFPMSCGDGNPDRPQPEVLDVFPRVAALNLSETKYRDQQWSIGTALQWLGFGVNSSFNREHLQLSQVLGQSSYITGRGIGQSNFGWRYGISLGDSEISSGTKTTFALISVPEGCSPNFNGAEMRWIRRNLKPADRWYSSRDESQNEGRFSVDAADRLYKAYQTAQLVRKESLSENSNPLIRTIYVNRATDDKGNRFVNLGIEFRKPHTDVYAAVDMTDAGKKTRLTFIQPDDDQTLDSWRFDSPKQITLRLNEAHFNAGFPAITLRSRVTGDLLLDQFVDNYCPTVMVYDQEFSPKVGADGRPLCGALMKQLATDGPSPVASPSWLKEIRFNRTAYSSPTAPTILVTLLLSDDLDQQTSITADDIILRRTRDPFSRAVNASAPTGLLESSTIAPNTWMTLNARTVILSLDSSAFGQHFPNIVISSPSGSYDLRSVFSVPNSCPVVNISGRNVNLASEGGEKLTCFDLLPNLAYKAATLHTVSAARVLAGLPGPDVPRIVFTDTAASNGTSTSVSTNTTSEVQISSGQRSSVWGNSAEAYELNKNGSMRRLQCDSPVGSRYSCYLPGKANDAAFDGANFRVVDLNHKVDKTGTIGTLEAWAALEDCDDSKSSKCRVPSFWDFGIDPSDTSWTLTFDFVNVPDGITLTGTLSGFTVQSHASATSAVTPLTVQLTVQDLMQRKLTDHMTLKVSCSPGPCPKFPDQSVAISNLYSHFVPVADAGADWTNWTGINLLHTYTKLQIGKNPAHNISCNDQSRCTLDGDLDKDTSGQISLLDDAGDRIPLLQLVNGKLVNAAYTKPKGGAGGAGGGKSTGGQIIIVNGSTPATATIDSLLPSLGAQQQITTETPK